MPKARDPIDSPPPDSPHDSLHDSLHDSQGDNLLMRLLPDRLRGFGQLARLDRPIGTWLLFWPCFWGMALAAGQNHAYPPAYMIVLFAIGSLVMRGAGCTFNDIADRKIDAKVERTALRPLPSGRVSVLQAWQFLFLQAFIGLIILLQFNLLTIILGVASLALVATYPFMKRITWWPQFFLGLTFNWGILMGYSALADKIDAAALVLYAAGIFWTLGYDTIYAHQDREDDALIGVKSAALRLGRATKPALVMFYTLTVILLAVAGSLADMAGLYWAGLAIAAWHLAMQIVELDIDRPDVCLRLFRANRNTGIIIAGAVLLGAL